MDTKDEIKTDVTPLVETPKVEATVEAVKTTIGERITNILQANSLITNLKADNARLVKDLSEAQNAFKNLQDMAQGEVEMKANYEKQLSDMKADYESQLSKTSVDTQITEEKIAVKASQVLSNIGIEAGTIEVNTQVKSVYDKYAEMPQGTARNVFFEANKAAILKELELRKASK